MNLNQLNGNCKKFNFKPEIVYENKLQLYEVKLYKQKVLYIIS